MRYSNSFCRVVAVLFCVQHCSAMLPCIAEERAATASLGARLAQNGPIFVGDEYKCADMVWAVNELQRAGKDEAIRALKEYVNLTVVGDNKPKYDSLWLICRCLFEKPGGWPPFLGAPTVDPRATTHAQKDALRKFPLYPIVLSSDVPFMMGRGYVLGGPSENPLECTELCESLPIRKTQLPTKGFEAAAKALIESPQFAELFPNPASRKAEVEMILNQSRKGVER